MRVAVIGGTGNVGSQLVDALAADESVTSVVAIARRLPDIELPKVRWAAGDITADDLAPSLEGADVAVHLAWKLQPSHDPAATWRINVLGSIRVFEAVARAGIKALVYASSVGAYSPAPTGQMVDESWPTHGVPTLAYSREKAYVERVLDTFEAAHPAIRVARLRPGLVFQGAAGPEVRRYFAGPLLPQSLVARGVPPVFPNIRELRLQAVHAEDMAEAYRLAVTTDAHGAYNIASDPVLDAPMLARSLNARLIPGPARLVRVLAGATWAARLQPTSPGWVDLALASPLLDTTRARTELGWAPRWTAVEALDDLLEGMRSGTGAPRPPLEPDAGGPLRSEEFPPGT